MLLIGLTCETVSVLAVYICGLVRLGQCVDCRTHHWGLDSLSSKLFVLTSSMVDFCYQANIQV